MLSVLLALSMVGSDQGFSYDGSYRLSVVVESVVTRSAGTVIIDPLEKIPDESYALKFRANSATEAARMLAAQSPLRVMSLVGGKVKLHWTVGAPAKGVVRLYEEPAGYVVQVGDTTVARLAKELEQAFALEGDTFVHMFQRAGIKPGDPLKFFRSAAPTDKPAEGRDKEVFFARLTDSLAKHVIAATPTTVRSVWPLTFVQTNPPQLPGSKLNVDFAAQGMSAGTIAQALQAAFTPAGADAKPEVTVRSVGNSLVMEGKPIAVNEVRRLLATQLDIPQSQILLELDAYQVSAPISDPGDADRSVRLIMLGQEIARAYKVRYLEAIKSTLNGMNGCITEAIRNRSDLNVVKLFESAGIEVSTLRNLGQSELLLFMAYAEKESFQNRLSTNLSIAFCNVHHHLQKVLIHPLRTEDVHLADALEAVSKRIMGKGTLSHFKGHMCAHSSGSAVQTVLPPLRAFSIPGESGFETSRKAIEDFLLLWLANSSPEVAQQVLPETSEERVRTIEKQFNIFGQVNRSTPGDSTRASGYANPRYEALLKGDLPTSLARAANVIDGLMQTSMEILRHDTRYLVDEPLKAWMDKHLATKKDSRFGVRYGGTTTLAVTSRVPGVTGVTADSFFPFQPVAPIDLTNLVPILMRPTPKEKAQDEKEVADPTTTTPTTATADIFAANRLTAQEKFILEALFNQAKQPPFYRSIGTGLHFSVVPTTLANGSAARLQVRLALSVQPDDSNKSGAGDPNKPGPIDLIKSTMTETELIVNAFDTTLVSSLKVDVSAPAKREWEIPILSQILPIRSWFVGPTKDKTVRHEAIVLLRVTIVPKAMDLASRYLGSGR